MENVCGPASAGGTRGHHEADAQLSGTEAQHPSQPVPAEDGGRSAKLVSYERTSLACREESYSQLKLRDANGRAMRRA